MKKDSEFSGFRIEDRGTGALVVFNLKSHHEEEMKGGSTRTVTDAAFSEPSLLIRIQNLQASGMDVSQEQEGLKALRSAKGPAPK